jgi:putative phosphoribosyl transferase
VPWGGRGGIPLGKVHVVFLDRTDAGRRLAEIVRVRPLADPVVLALPRGGVPVGIEVARATAADFDVFVARKVGAPGRPELGVGAIAEVRDPAAAAGSTEESAEPTVWLDHGLLRRLGIGPADVAKTIEAEKVELQRRVRVYRGGRPPAPVSGRTVILVDDGIATGGTVRASLRALSSSHANRVLLAVPVGPVDVLASLGEECDEVLALAAPRNFRAVGAWYRVFDQLSDETVIALLNETIME